MGAPNDESVVDMRQRGDLLNREQRGEEGNELQVHICSRKTERVY